MWQECESAEFQLCGRTVSIGREGLQIGEALLNGRAMGIDEPSVAEIVLGAVNSHPDPAVRKVGCLHLVSSSPPSSIYPAWT